MEGPSGLDLEQIRHALSLARERGYVEVDLASGDSEFYAVLQNEFVPSTQTTEPAQDVAGSVSETEPEPLEIRATLVGIFRPNGATLEVGNTLKVGDTVGTIVALGLANPIESPVAGEISEVLVSADDPVMYGQVLARVKP